MDTEKRNAFTLAVAAQLRAEISAAGLSVAEAARRSNVPRGSLVRYLDGTRELPVSVMYQMADTLGISVPVFVTRADERCRTAMSQADYMLAARDANDDAEAEAQIEEP